MSLRLLAEAARPEHVAWYEQYLEIVKNPAHYAGEFTIETLFAIFGVHTLHKLAHRLVHTSLKRATRLGRLAGKRVK